MANLDFLLIYCLIAAHLNMIFCIVINIAKIYLFPKFQENKNELKVKEGHKIFSQILSFLFNSKLSGQWNHF